MKLLGRLFTAWRRWKLSHELLLDGSALQHLIATKAPHDLTPEERTFMETMASKWKRTEGSAEPPHGAGGFAK